MRPPARIADLERWEDSGATWRVLELTHQRALIELCTCSSEPVDVLQSEDPELIKFVSRRRDAERTQARRDRGTELNRSGRGRRDS